MLQNAHGTDCRKPPAACREHPRSQSSPIFRFQTREPWHLSCHGSKTPANSLSLKQSRALWARCGVKITTPCASREACRRAAVASQPIGFSRAALRATGAQSGVKGGERKRVSSGHNRRRRLATGSRQPKRGFGTAVPKTTIEVADHCPCLSGRWLRGRIRRTRGSSRCRRR